MPVVQLTRELSVKAKVSGKLVSYSVFAARTDTEPVKTTRYSELAVLQKALKSEVDDFRASLPPKTLRHQTSPDFVETRRGAIEGYLQMCTTNRDVTNSQAWKNFLSDAVFPTPATASAVAAAQGDSAPGSVAASFEAPLHESAQSRSGGTPTPVPTADAIPETGHESEEEDINLEGSVYDKLRTQLAIKKANLANVEEQKGDLGRKLNSGQTALQLAEEEIQVDLEFRRESLQKLTTHQYQLQELERDLMTQKGAKADIEASKNSQVKSLEEGLKAATDATRTADAKFQAARSARTQAEAEGKNSVKEAGIKTQAALVEHIAASEHVASMKAALAVMTERLKERELEARKIEIECDVSMKSRDTVQQETDVVKEELREIANKQLNTSAALASHTESAARRKRAFEAEVRRAKDCSEQAAKLRDRRSRGELVGEDRKAFENAESLANKGAEAAGKALTKTLKRQEDSLKADTEKGIELRKADDKGKSDLKQREVVMKQMETRLGEVSVKYTDASSKRAAANASKKVARDDYTALKTRIEGELQKNLEDAEKKLKDVESAGKIARTEVDKKLAPLSHKEDAERVVLKQAEAAEANLVQMLDEARTLAAEAKGDQLEAMPDDHEKVQKGEKRSLLLESVKIRVSDCKQALSKAKAAATEADGALKKADPELKELEQRFELERATFQKEVEAMLQEEAGSRGSSFAEELKEDVHEEDSPVLQDMLQKIAVLKAHVDDLKLVSEEKNAQLSAAAAASESAEAEMAQLEEEEKNTEMPPLTGYYLSQELEIVAERKKTHEEHQGRMLDDQKQRKEDWEKEKIRLNEELHQAGMSIAVAKDDLEAAKNIRKSLGK